MGEAQHKLEHTNQESKGDTVLAAGVEGQAGHGTAPLPARSRRWDTELLTDASPHEHTEQPGPAEAVWLQGRRRRSLSAAPGCRLGRMGTQKHCQGMRIALMA